MKMVIGAGTAIEHHSLLSRVFGGLTLNFGLSSRCPLKSRCGSNCALIKTLPQTADMLPTERDAAIDECLDAGPTVRHFVACEWEPFAEPEALRRTMRAYHAR